MRFQRHIVASILVLSALGCRTVSPETMTKLQAENVAVRLEGTHKLPIFDGAVPYSTFIATSSSIQLVDTRWPILQQITVPNNKLRRTAVPGTYKIQLKPGQFLHSGSYEIYTNDFVGVLAENWVQTVIEVRNDQLFVRDADTRAGTNTQNNPSNAGQEWSIMNPLGTSGIILFRYLGKRTIEVTIPPYTAPLKF